MQIKEALDFLVSRGFRKGGVYVDEAVHTASLIEN